MAVTRLDVYNMALETCDERGLTSLTENAHRRRYLDTAWGNGRIIKACLEAGRFSFALRTASLEPDSAVTPAFGYQNAFQLPTDYAQLDMISSDELFEETLIDYRIENGFIYSSVSVLYISYSSTDAAYGGDLSKWPEAFADFVAKTLASKIVGKLSASRTLKSDVYDLLKVSRNKALGVDAKAKPARVVRSGAWTRARMGYARRTSAQE